MIPKPKKLTEEQKKELRQFYPPFVNEKIIELNNHPEINDRPNTEITDFYIQKLQISIPYILVFGKCPTKTTKKSIGYDKSLQ